MIKKYHPLFQLGLSHTYFQSGKAEDLSLEPTPGTSRLMHKLGLRGTKRPEGFAMYWSAEEQGSETRALIKTEENPLVLNFILRTANPSFYNYTDISLEQEKMAQCFYFHNQNQTLGGELSTSTPNHAHPSKTIVGDADLRSFGNSQQVIEFPPFGENEEQVATLKDVAGNVISSGPIPSQQLTEGRYLLNLAEEDSGYYELLIGSSADAADALRQVIYYLPDQEQQRSLGLIQIVIDPTSLTLEEDQQAPPQFQLSFANRHTKWRYILMNNNNLNFDDVGLTLVEQAISIQKPSEEDRQNEPDKYTISLQEARPLQEVYPQHLTIQLLQLAEGADASSTPETTQQFTLPSPDVQRIYPARVDGTLEYYSDMFIYL